MLVFVFFLPASRLWSGRSDRGVLTVQGFGVGDSEVYVSLVA